MEIVTEAEDAEALRRLAADELVSGLLVLHDLHPLSTAERVREALDRCGPSSGCTRAASSCSTSTSRGRTAAPAGHLPRLPLVAGHRHGRRSNAPSLAAAPEVSRVDVEGVVDDRAPLLQIQHRPPGSCPVPEAVS